MPYGGDSFRFVLGPFDFGLGQKDAFGDVLPRDLVTVGVGDVASVAAGAVVAGGAGQLTIAAGA